MRRLRLFVLAFAVAIGGALLPVSPARAAVPPAVSGGHWSYFKWSTTWQPVRAFYVLDRSGDATVHSALQAVINDLKYDLTARNAWGIVPAPAYLLDDANIGQCDSTATSPGYGFQNFVNYSFITVCSGGPANGTSVTWTSGGHLGENYHPSMHIDRFYSDYNTTYSTVGHELLHALGVRHTDNCSDLMGGSEYGCTLTVGVLKHPSGADYDALTNFYGGYGAWGHPWNG